MKKQGWVRTYLLYICKKNPKQNNCTNGDPTVSEFLCWTLNPCWDPFLYFTEASIQCKCWHINTCQTHTVRKSAAWQSTNSFPIPVRAPDDANIRSLCVIIWNIDTMYVPLISRFFILNTFTCMYQCFLDSRYVSLLRGEIITLYINLMKNLNFFILFIQKNSSDSPMVVHKA